MRLNFLYIHVGGFRDHGRQLEQVRHAGNRAALRLFHKGVFWAGIGPGGWQMGLATVFCDVIDAPLSPALAMIDQFKSSPMPRMKRMRNSEKLFCLVCIGCSSQPMPRGKLKLE